MTGPITSDTARLPVMLTQLRLPTVARLWPTISETADREGWPAARTLAALLELQDKRKSPLDLFYEGRIRIGGDAQLALAIAGSFL